MFDILLEQSENEPKSLKFRVEKCFVMKKINWESLSTEGRFEVDKEEDGDDYSINDDC